MTQTYKILKRDNDATDMSLYRDGMYVRRITDEYEEDVIRSISFFMVFILSAL